MDPRKKILIFYASAGHGHEKAARAVLEAVLAAHPDADAKLVDTVSLMAPFVGNGYRQTYLLQIKYAPWLWGVCYYLLDVPLIYFFARFVRRAFNALTSKGLVEMILREKPDVVLTAHFYAAEVVSRLKAKKKTEAKLVTVVTDYFAHYIWTAPCTDSYAVGLEETREGLVRRGVDAERIQVTGIPVEKKFFRPVDRAAVFSRLGLDAGLFTVLITSGGVGIGAMEPLLKKILTLEKPVQVVLVCGTNKVLYGKVTSQAFAHKRLKALGFVDYMNELMECADVVVGKAGGLTITESFLKNKPVIMTGSIPGQEARNVVCVKAHHAGIEASGASEVAEAVSLLAGSEIEMKRLKSGAAEIARPGAAQAIAALAGTP